MKSLLYSVLLLILFCCCLKYSHSVMDTISPGKNITYPNTIISAGSEFKLGFFQPGSPQKYYLGIWYNKVSVQTIVWVGNRDYQITSLSAVLSVDNDGNLVILDGKVSYTVNNVKLVNTNTSATLLDSGNLVLRDKNLNILWQSFDYPSHTFLPGMKIGYSRVSGKTWSLVSWRSTEDPSAGDYSLELSRNGTGVFNIMKGAEEIWSSGPWNGRIFSLVPEMRLNYIFNYSFFSNDDMTYFTYDLYNKSIISSCKIDVTGQLKQSTWLESAKQWNLFWSQPRDNCEVNDSGAFGACNQNSRVSCSCLPGFETQVSGGGCVRKTKLSCTYLGNDSQLSGASDKFFKLSKVALPGSPLPVKVDGSDKCQSFCLQNCSCTGYNYLVDRCSIWVGDLLKMQVGVDGIYGTDFYLRLDPSEFSADDGNTSKKLQISIPLSITLIVFTIALFIFLKRRKNKRTEGEDLLLFDPDATMGASIDEVGEVNLLQNARKDVEIPFFSFSSISMATNNFSAANKLGEGGFGPVFKGELLNGSEVAVKRLSKRSGQGWDELRNEAMLIAKLQHKNLVKLLGCCIEGDEKILIYEYMQNKSLDFFIFDPTKRGLLDWGTRIGIIGGIAQGILYLHQFSRLQIIHRDLKVSNILLDKDMNPKISDFGMARIYGGSRPQATNRIVGTYGYMAPEYALQGLFSVKSDVFSFGVLLLEILSGKKNTGFYNTNSLNLLGYAWDLWRSSRSLDLMDPILGDISSTNTGSRYINIALLCVQETAADRPTMSDVVSMLSNEHFNLPSPSQPAFSNVRSVVFPESGNNMADICSVNDVTVTILKPR